MHPRAVGYRRPTPDRPPPLSRPSWSAVVTAAGCRRCASGRPGVRNAHSREGPAVGHPRRRRQAVLPRCCPPILARVGSPSVRRAWFPRIRASPIDGCRQTRRRLHSRFRRESARRSIHGAHNVFRGVAVGGGSMINAAIAAIPTPAQVQEAFPDIDATRVPGHVHRARQDKCCGSTTATWSGSSRRPWFQYARVGRQYAEAAGYGVDYNGSAYSLRLHATRGGGHRSRARHSTSSSSTATITAGSAASTRPMSPPR